MKRDMDLIRELLLAIERDERMDGVSKWQFDGPDDFGVPECSYQEAVYHLELLIENGFIKGTATMQMPLLSGLTWDGHEFLDAVRDPDVWSKTKQRVSGISSVGFSFLWEIAKSEIKVKLGLP